MRWGGWNRWACAVLMGPALAFAAALPQEVAVTTLAVAARTPAPDLPCASAKPAPRPPSVPEDDPVEMPDASMVQAEGLDEPRDAHILGALPPGTPPALGKSRPGEPYRVAIWGDSHLASGAFTGELVRLLGLAPERVYAGVVPAMNRPGVRLPVRRTCLEKAWRHEAAYVVATGAKAPGPGLVNLVSSTKGAVAGWDLRDAAGRPKWRQVSVLFQQTEAPLRLAVSIDGRPDVAVDLRGPAGPAALALEADAPLSTVRVRLVAGTLRLHGLALPDAPGASLRLDLFAYPGATVAGWDLAQADYLGAWFRDTRYDLAILGFGTNEGNVRPFDADRYDAILRRSLGNFRALFPEAACVLVAPPDRGVLVRRSEKARRKPAPAKGKAAVAAPSPDLLRYTRIHAEITRLQERAAAEHGCRTWSMLEAMGGEGSAYRWALETPPRMARDLIHLTASGYRDVAGRFAADLGWRADHLLVPAVPGPGGQ